MRIYPTKHELAALKAGQLTQLRRPQRLWHGAAPRVGELLYVAEAYNRSGACIRYRADAAEAALRKIRWRSACFMTEFESRFRMRALRVDDTATCRHAPVADLAALGYGESKTPYQDYVTDWREHYGDASWSQREKVWIIDVECLDRL